MKIRCICRYNNGKSILFTYLYILQIPLDSSNIIYFRKDNQTDEDDIQQENMCLPFYGKTKKFKRSEDINFDDHKTQTKSTKLKFYRNEDKQGIPARRHLREPSNSDYSNEVIELYF